MIIYCGLDIAKTTGLAVWYPEKHFALVTHVKGTPIVQLKCILAAIPKELFGEVLEPVFVLEKIFHFRNANTTRSLLERYGYMKHSLLDRAARVEEAHPLAARRLLKARSKGQVLRMLQAYSGECMTQDGADALAVAIFQAHKDGWIFDPIRLVVKGDARES